MVKKIVTLFAAILIVISIFAQVPQKMSYQAIIRNSYNVLVTNKKVSMKISILQNQTPVFVELQTTTTNENGLINVEIGNGIVLSGVFANIDWGKGVYYIKTETDPDGGTYYSIAGTSELLSVPYALYSTSSGGGVSIDDTSASTTKTWSSGKINSELGNKVNSSALATVATTGNFSDLKGKPTTLAGYGITDGGTGTGTGTSLPMSGDATQNTTGVVTISNNAVTSAKILDGTVGNVDLDKSNIPLSGFGAPTANIPMGGFKITNLATPVNAKDAVTKGYVDAALLTTATPVLSLDAAQNLSIKGGNAVSLADLYQSLSLAGTILSISGPRDSHVDLAAIFGSSGGSGGGSGIVSHDTSLTGSGTSLSLLGIASQAITPTKISGISTNGNYGQVLTSNGSGSFNWTDMGSGGGGGLTSVNVIPSGGITSSVSNILPNSTITLGLGAITPSSINTSGSITTTGNITGSTLTGNLNTSNLTGTLSTALFGANTIPVTAIVGSGTAGTFLKGDGTWGIPAAGSSVASGISNTAITGVTGTNVQTTLESLKTLIDGNSSDITSKLTGNAAISGASHTKITYDSKGLVTAGTDATAAEVTVAGGDGIIASNVQGALKELSGRITTASAGGMTNVTHDATLTGDGNTTNLGLADNAVSSSKIADRSVTLAKLANITGPALLGKVSSTAGTPEVITIGTGLTLTGTTLSANGGMSVVNTDATLTGNGNGTNLGLADKAVSLSKMSDLAANSLIGAVSTGTPQAIKIGSGLTLSGITLSTSTIAPGATGGDITLLNPGGTNYLSLTGQTLSASPVDLSGSTDAAGILAPVHFPALTGDITNTSGTVAMTLKPVGTAGTYKSVTTDAQGRVISGTNPTTLIGYGITDAAPLSHNHALDALTDVSVSVKSAGDFLQWNGSNWINFPLITGNQSIAFTPNATGDVTGTATGTTLLTPSLVIGAGKVTNTMLAGGIDLTTKVTGVLPIANVPKTLTGITSVNGLTLNSLATGFSITGGTTPKTFTVTDNANISGSNTGDQTAVTVTINPISGVSGGTVQAALGDIKNQIDGNSTAISAKLTGNSAITAATKTKITYDAKGLVTAGTDATTADITESANKKYVTDAQSIALGNLSGINTGDQSASGVSVAAGDGVSASNVQLALKELAGRITTAAAGGMTSVSHDATLTGDGILTSDLGVSDKGITLAKMADIPTSSLLGRSTAGTGTPETINIGSGLALTSGTLTTTAGALNNMSNVQITGATANDILLWNGSKWVNDNSLLATKIDISAIGASTVGSVKGVVPLNTLGKIDEGYLPGSMVGAVNYVGVYDASTNSIGAATLGTKGNYFVVSVAGTTNSIPFSVGDWIISDGTQWSKVSNNNGVTTVFGRSGIVSAALNDYNTDLVNEPAVAPHNLYFTDARVAANATVAAKEDKANKSTDGTLASVSDVKYPSEKAVKTYVDAKVPASSALINGQVLTVAGGVPSWQALTTGGTVTTVSVTPTAGVTGVVTNPGTTPAIAISLGAISPTSISTGAITATTVSTTGAISASGAVTGLNIPLGSTVSGTNAGDQQITLTGDVTGTGAARTTSIVTTIPDASITTAKITNLAIVTGKLADGSVTPLKLKNIVANGTSGQILSSDGTGGFTWGASVATDLSYTPSATNGIVVSSSGNDATIPAGSTSNASLMLPGDKTKLDGIASGATNYVLPLASAATLGGIKVGANLSIDGAGVLSATTGGLSAINASSLLGNSTAASAVPTSLDATAVKSLLALSNVDNTTDVNKPMSTLTKTYVDSKTGSATASALGLIQLAGDLGGTGGTATAPLITNNAVTYAKMQTMSAIGLLGSPTAGANVSQIALGTNLSFTGNTLNVTGGSGDMLLGTSQLVTALKTFNGSMLAVKGTGAGASLLTTANNTGANNLLTLPATAGTLALFTDIPITSAALFTKIPDRTGSGGALVFATSPTLTTPALGDATALTITASGQYKSTLATGTAPFLVTSTTPVANLSIGGTAANIAGGTAGDILYQSATGVTAKAAKGTAGQVLTMDPTSSFPIWTAGGGSGDMVLASPQSVTGVKTFDNLAFAMKGTSGVGTTSLASANASGTNYTLTLPAANGTVALTADAPTTSAQLATQITDETGTGALVFANNPALGAVTATSLSATGAISTAGSISSTAGNITSTNGYVQGTTLKSTVATGTAPFSVVSATPVTGLSITGNAATASSIMGGSAGQVLYQSGTGATSMVPVGTAGQVLTSTGSGAPTWSSAAAGGGVPTATIPADAGKVLTVDSSTGTAQWQTAPSGGGSGLALYTAPDIVLTPTNASFIYRATGTVTVTQGADIHHYIVTIPAGVTLDYFRMYATQPSLGGQSNLDIMFTFLGKELYNSPADLIFPDVKIIDNTTPVVAGGAAVYTMLASGATYANMKITYINAGSIQVSTTSLANHTSTNGFWFSVRF